MRDISTFGLICLVGAAVAFVEMRNGSAPAGPPSVQAAAKAPYGAKDNPDTEFADHPVRVLFNYLHPNVAIPQTALDCEAPIPSGGTEIDSIIATVVDPGRTRLSLALDRQFDAILKAARDSGYQFQDLWLPWRATAGSGKLDREEARERLPGLIMFRDGNRLLTVWLVGETPTAGISRPQFRRAACFAENTGKARLLGILGPTFSGTLASLKSAIAADLHVQPDVLSGTTTAARAIEDFASVFRGYRSMIHDDDYAQARLRDYLERRYNSRPSLVMLAESDTAFGNEFNAPDLIRYPREISRLRNAYQSDPKVAAQKNGDAEKWRQLLLPLHDSAAGQDTIPNFSLQTPSSLETVLFQIAGRLRNGGFDTAVLTGSNVLDTLFLGRFLTLNVPDTRVVVFDSDLLFIHGSDSLDLLGTLSVSRYPLHPQLERTKPLDLFASMSERGLYEAGLRLMSKKTLPDLPSQEAIPLWLSVVGRGSYWPVAILNPQPKNPKLEIGNPLHVWNAVFWIATLLSLRLAWLLLSSGGQLQEYRPASAAVYQTLALVFAAAAYWALAANPVQLASVAQSWAWTAQAIAGIMTLLALLLAAFGNIRVSRMNWRTAGLAAGSILLTGAVAWPGNPGSGGDLSAVFRAVRSVNLSSGVAPDVPLLFFLLSLAWWSWTNRRRMIFVAEREVIKPPIERMPDYYFDRIIQLLRRPLVCEVSSGFIAAAVAVACIVTGWRSLASVEASPFDLLITALLAANSAALLYTTTGLFAVWRLLHSYLKVLHLHGSQDMDALANSVHLQSFWTMGPEDNTFPMAREGVKVFREILVNPKYAVIAQDVDTLESKLEKTCEHVRQGERIPAALSRRIREIPVEIAEKLRALRPHSPEIEAHIAKAVSLFHVAFIKYVLRQLRTLYFFLVGGFLLTACAMHSYPFQGAGFLRWWTGLLVVAPAIAVTTVWFQMEYDPILSKLSDGNRKEGLNLGSWQRLAKAGAVPLLAGMSALFPQVGHFLFAWIYPTLQGIQ